MDDLTLFLYLFLLLLLATTTPPPTPTIPITNNSTLNYTINGDTITSPESFVNGSFTVHAIESSTLKNLSVSGDRLSSPPISVEQMNRNGDPGLDKSYAQELSNEFAVGFLLVCLVFWLKINGFYPNAIVFLIVSVVFWLYINEVYPFHSGGLLKIAKEIDR